MQFFVSALVEHTNIVAIVVRKWGMSETLVRAQDAPIILQTNIWNLVGMFLVHFYLQCFFHYV